jgi:hypothetical protein
MPDTPTDQPEHSKRGDGFPGRDDWNQVHDRFRAVLARLARDQDPEAAATAGRIVHRATQMLTALTAEAVSAQEKADQERARADRQHRATVRAVNRLGRAGRPLPPSLAALVTPPEERP